MGPKEWENAWEPWNFKLLAHWHTLVNTHNLQNQGQLGKIAAALERNKYTVHHESSDQTSRISRKVDQQGLPLHQEKGSSLVVYVCIATTIHTYYCQGGQGLTISI